ncbi:carboxypeptidase-like regulatory domain-containing protein [uncultured Paludibaculum sp.]|uniref:carboxypeptidase-like regulatory domain-containing protein n=1 Tax=uncultured Paludibaculum sp. TaxID=1765020 RepID=UPI002AAC2231|nr:carboxypeptidase-like regulatory domain-containing protein [uncultured Paludibaculum sp.]
MNRRFFVLLPLLAMSLFAFQFTNQKKSKRRDPNVRNVEGVVTQVDGTPAVGAVVQLKNMQSLAVKSFITQDGGKYQFQNLSTHTDYELKADWKEFASPTRALTIFDTRLDAILNLKLEPKKADEKK